LCFGMYADELLHTQHAHANPFIDQLVKDLFGGNIKVSVPGLGKLLGLWNTAKEWLEEAKAQSAEKATPPEDPWVLALAYLYENFRQHQGDAEELRCRLEVEQKKCKRLGPNAKIDDLALALGLPFYRNESLITSEKLWRPGRSENDGDGRRAEDAVSACTSSTDHPCRAHCTLECHRDYHNNDDKRLCCWHFVIYWRLVRQPTDTLCDFARQVFSEHRCLRFDSMVQKALEQAVEQQGERVRHVGTLATVVIQRMLFIYWDEISSWIDESVVLRMPEREGWSEFRQTVNEKNIEYCEPLRGSVKAFGTAGSAILRDVSIDA
jgi:hypothetical protein